MTLLTKSPRFFPGFSSSLMDFFNEDFDWRNGWTSKVPAANITEQEKGYNLELAAPGLQKEDFQISVENGQLSISCEKQQEEESTEDRYSRKEFSYESFERTFALPESVESDKINASYQNGVLSVEIPKKKTALKAPAKQISVG